MKLIVGLGNPGKEYDKTKHNIGFMFIDSYAEKHKALDWKEKYNGIYTSFMIDNEKVILLKPQSYMNLSGTVVKRYIDYFKISIDDVLIISDDLDLDVGVYRLRAKGSSGGHNGLKDIEQNIGTSDFKRLKIGISNNKEIDTKDFVLSKISNDDLMVYDKMHIIVNEILDSFIGMNFEELMNKYNHR